MFRALIVRFPAYRQRERTVFVGDFGGWLGRSPVRVRLLPVTMMEPAPVSLARRIVSVLSPVLGRHTATKAAELVCKRLEKDADALIDADLQPACEILLPVLRQLVGGAVAEQVLIRLQTSHALDMETK